MTVYVPEASGRVHWVSNALLAAGILQAWLHRQLPKKRNIDM
jgi:hypothetical protein